MMKWENSIIVQRPAEDVFAFITDPQKSSTWHRSNEITPISDGPIREGKRYRVTGKFFLWKFKSESVVSEFKENHLVTFQSSSRQFPFVLRYVLEPVDNGTRLTEIGEADPPTLMKLALSAYIGSAKRNSERGLRLLKTYLEAGSDR